MIATAAGAAFAAAGVCSWASVNPRAQLFGRVVSRLDKPNAIALTFDDGPNPAVTPRLLQLLDDNQVRATFFMIGKHVRACPELAREVVARGHAVGNHTETHPNLFWCSRKENERQLGLAQEAIESATRTRPSVMRPPYGSRNPFLARAARQFGYRVITWTLIGFDWEPQPLPKLVDRLRPVSGGYIVCLHDGAPEALNADRSLTLRALDFWLPRWKDAGLEFVTL
jgi:peptidoglycan/xylan/chitin deacetylase (PgdA/CDA1 family)